MVRRAVAVAAFGLGFVGGTQVGPIWLLSARSVLRRGFVVGLRIVGDAVDRPAARRFGGDRRAPVLRIASCRLGFGIGGGLPCSSFGASTAVAPRVAPTRLTHQGSGVRTALLERSGGLPDFSPFGSVIDPSHCWEATATSRVHCCRTLHPIAFWRLSAACLGANRSRGCHAVPRCETFVRSPAVESNGRGVVCCEGWVATTASVDTGIVPRTLRPAISATKGGGPLKTRRARP